MLISQANGRGAGEDNPAVSVRGGDVERTVADRCRSGGASAKDFDLLHVAPLLFLVD